MMDTAIDDRAERDLFEWLATPEGIRKYAIFADIVKTSGRELPTSVWEIVKDKALITVLETLRAEPEL